MNASGSNFTNKDISHDCFNQSTPSNVCFNQSTSSNDCFNQSTPSNVSETLFHVSVVIRQVAPLPFLLLGILGNLLTMAVLLRQRVTNTFTGVSLLFLAVVDNMNMLAYFLPDWLGAVAGQDYRSLGNTSCQIALFFTCISQFTSPWALVAITMERIACVWPLELKKSFTPRMSLCVHAVLFAVAIMISMYAFEVYEVSENAMNVYGFACGTFAHHGDAWMAMAMNYVANVLMFFVPFILLLAGNSVILKKLSVRTNFAMQRGDAITTSRYRKLSKLVALLNVVFFFSQFPLAVLMIFDAQALDWIFSGSCEDEFWHRLGVYRLITTCCSVMALVSPSTNFLLYFVSSSQFRQEIKAFLKREKPGETILFNDGVGTACTTV